MSVQGYIPTKDTELEMALEEPPATPVTWVGVPVDVDIYDISGMPLVRSVVDTTTLGASRFREQTKLLYDAIEVNFTFFHTASGLEAWNILLDTEDPSDRWWKLIFGDGSNFIFAAGVTKLDTISGPVDDVVRVEATLTASGEVTYSST